MTAEPVKAGVVRQFRRPEGHGLLGFQQTALRRLADAERRLPGLLDDILACARAADPLLLYSRLIVLSGMRRAVLGHISFGMDAMLEFYGGLVTSMPADEVVARVGTEYNPLVLYEMDRLLREYAVAENRVQEGQALREGASNPLVGARHLLEFEQRFDRMLGYPAQLRPIFHAITDPLADQSRSTLGFALGDALVVADAYSAELTELRRNVVEEFRVLLDRIPADADRETVIQHLVGHAAGVATFGAAPAEDDLVGVLVERTSITRGEVAALVTALATSLGSQPHLTAMHETNSRRRRPIISFPDGAPPLGIAGRLHPHRPGLGGRGLPTGHRVDQSVRPTATDHVRTTRLPSPGRSLQRARRPSGCHLLRRRATTGY